eukprot:1161761-Pelagomonas_calceolata.AAC.10
MSRMMKHVTWLRAVALPALASPCVHARLASWAGRSHDEAHELAVHGSLACMCMLALPHGREGVTMKRTRRDISSVICLLESTSNYPTLHSCLSHRHPSVIISRVACLTNSP